MNYVDTVTVRTEYYSRFWISIFSIFFPASFQWIWETGPVYYGIGHSQSVNIIVLVIWYQSHCCDTCLALLLWPFNYLLNKRQNAYAHATSASLTSWTYKLQFPKFPYDANVHHVKYLFLHCIIGMHMFIQGSLFFPTVY